MSNTPPLYIDTGWLTAAAPTYPDPSGWMSASMPKPADVTLQQTPESPPSRTTFIVADQSYPVAWESHSPVTNVVSDVRPEMTVAIVIAGDGALAILKTALVGGTAALLLADGRTVTMYGPKIESWQYLDDALSGYPKSSTGNRIGVLRLSADSRQYRST